MENTRDIRFLEKLLGTGQWPDVTIDCEGRQWQLHRTILSEKSPYFRAMFEISMREACSQFVKLEEETPSLVARALSYIYTSDYPTSVEAFSGQLAGGSDEWADCTAYRKEERLHILMYSLADRWQIPSLKELSRSKYDMAAEPSLDDNDSEFSDEYLEEELQNIRLIYATTPSSDLGLRVMALFDLHYGMQELNYLRKASFLKFLEENGSVARDIIISKLCTYEHQLANREASAQPYIPNLPLKQKPMLIKLTRILLQVTKAKL
ncbi:MAG: hypothetical protein Q9227_002047 [Pyrenula ochraceoflavens]